MEAASNIVSKKLVKLDITPAKLWQVQKPDNEIVYKTFKHIPILKIAPDVIHEMYIASHSANRTRGWLLGFQDEHLKINIEDIRWESIKKLTNFAFRVRQGSLLHEHYSDMLRTLHSLSNENIAKNYQEITPEADNQLFTLSISYQIENDCLKLECGLVYIDISFQLCSIFPLKIVSTELSRELVKQKARKFKYGFLTMDQSKRLFPMALQDEMCVKYPLVGVWVTGISNKVRHYKGP